jgi:hypothetical protein
VTAEVLLDIIEQESTGNSKLPVTSYAHHVKIQYVGFSCQPACGLFTKPPFLVSFANPCLPKEFFCTFASLSRFLLYFFTLSRFFFNHFSFHHFLRFAIHIIFNFWWATVFRPLNCLCRSIMIFCFVWIRNLRAAGHATDLATHPPFLATHPTHLATHISLLATHPSHLANHHSLLATHSSLLATHPSHIATLDSSLSVSHPSLSFSHPSLSFSQLSLSFSIPYLSFSHPSLSI